MGSDKARLTIGGEPLWQRQLHLLQSLAPAKIFFAGPPPTDVAKWNCDVVADAQPDAGPLAGLVAGLRACRTPLLLALAVDLPRMSTAFLRGLLKRCEQSRGIVPATDRFEPLAAVYPIEALALAEEQLAAGYLSLQDFANRCLKRDLVARHSLSADEVPLFFNLNTPADLERVQ